MKMCNKRRVLLLPLSGGVGIHGQCFHQQIEMTALVIKYFMRIVGGHKAKVKRPELSNGIIYQTIYILQHAALNGIVGLVI